MTAKKKPIAITLVQRSRKESIDLDLFLVKNVSAEDAPVTAPTERWWPSWNKTTSVKEIASIIKTTPITISNMLI